MPLIALDAMGGDYAPEETVKGAVAAAREGIGVVLVGREAEVGKQLRRHGYRGSLIALRDAPQVVGFEDSPLKALREKPQSSIAIGIEMLKAGEADAFVSAGATGAVVAAAALILDLMEGIERPAIGLLYGTQNGPALFLDVGANPDCRPAFLLQFAYLGKLYMERVVGVAQPRIGLLSNGEEDSKGNQLVRQTFALLKESPLRFVGNVEARDLFRGRADVVVTDGFTGNVVLKATEGFGENLLVQLRGLFRHPAYRVLGLFLYPLLSAFKKRVDYSEHGGAPLLGVRGNIIIAHGRSKARAIRNALRLADRAARQGLAETLTGGSQCQNQ